jgi:hypothetical protein
MKLQVTKDLSKVCLVQAVAIIVASLPVIVSDSKPAHAACRTIQGNYGSSYFVCSTGNSVILQGSNSRTGAYWSENCFGVGTSFTTCSGTDAPAFRKDDTPLNRKPGGLMEQSNASLQRGDQG